MSRPGEMTIRVSRDSGRTWTPKRTVVPDATKPPARSDYPPCRCPKCRTGRAS